MFLTPGTSQGVTDLCGNTDTNLINRVLPKARARVTSILAKKGLTVPSSDVDLDTAVEAIAAKLIATAPGNVDPRTGFKVDGFERKDGSDSQLKEFQSIADDAIADYITNNVSVATTMPVMKVVSRDGVEIGEYGETD